MKDEEKDDLFSFEFEEGSEEIGNVEGIKEKLKEVVAQFMKERESLVDITLECKDCNTKWKTPINSKINGIQPNFFCPECKKEVKYEDS